VHGRVWHEMEAEEDEEGVSPNNCEATTTNVNSAMNTVVTEAQVEETIRKFHEVRELKHRICRAVLLPDNKFGVACNFCCEQKAPKYYRLAARNGATKRCSLDYLETHHCTTASHRKNKEAWLRKQRKKKNHEQQQKQQSASLELAASLVRTWHARKKHNFEIFTAVRCPEASTLVAVKCVCCSMPVAQPIKYLQLIRRYRLEKQ